MADAKTYASIGEKFEDITKPPYRKRSGTVWLTNDADNARNPENPVLVEVEEKQFRRPNSPFVKQGYRVYVHQKAVPSPVEAKAVPKQEQPKN